MNRVMSFAPGPSPLPLEVLLEIQRDLPDWNGTGISILEMSHRSPEFMGIYRETVANLRELYTVPEDYEILFVQGGGHMEFAMVPLNFKSYGIGNYLVNGVWSQKAFNEAVKLGGAAEAAHVANRVPSQEEIKESEGAGYLYYCSNETVNGVQYHYVPKTESILISDMSSDFLSRPVDISKYGLIYAGAQKNFGPAGLTVVIARKDLLGKCSPNTPSMLDYQTYAKSESMYNTPPTFAIYVACLVSRWLLKEGGVSEMNRRSIVKSSMLYDRIDNSDGFYRNRVEKKSRSLMNVVFDLHDEELNEAFINGAKERGIVSIKGHRIVGGMRASIYNSVTIEATEKLAQYMDDFRKSH